MSPSKQDRKKKKAARKAHNRRNVNNAANASEDTMNEQLYIRVKFKMIFIAVFSITVLCLLLNVIIALIVPDSGDSLRSLEDTLNSGFKLELRVRHRMARQEITIPYELVIHEAALRIRVSDRAASQAQLARLLEFSATDHITVRVIPFDLDGFARAASTMTYLGGPVPKLDTVVRDVPHGSAFIDSEAQLNAFRTRFRKVEAVSLDPERSRDFIHRLAKEL
ncbi:Scr1 family TA system antitoxin-like transcriptional regulator [Micrococcus luteus]